MMILSVPFCPYNFVRTILSPTILSQNPMHCLWYATRPRSAVSCILPAWWGCARAADRERIDRFLRKLHRAGYSHKVHFDDLIKPAAGKLRCKVKKNNECNVLRPLFPPLAQRSHSLRPRAHDFVLPRKDYKNYILRIFYRLSNSVVKSKVATNKIQQTTGHSSLFSSFSNINIAYLASIVAVAVCLQCIKRRFNTICSYQAYAPRQRLRPISIGLMKPTLRNFII